MKKSTFILLVFLQLNLISNIIYSMSLFSSYDFKSYDYKEPTYKIMLPKWWNN
ncbi:Uncharacterised protein [uncultured Clostridium sp.]|nr:Uncharacterised protein [uncultured Clostridium sp.]